MEAATPISQSTFLAVTVQRTLRHVRGRNSTGRCPDSTGAHCSSECPRSAEEAQELLKASTKPPAPAVPTGGSEKRPEENQSRKGGEDEDEDHQPLCHKLPEGVREMKDLQGPFKAGSHLEVGCALGWQPLNQSEETWHVKCVGWDAWTDPWPHVARSDRVRKRALMSFLGLAVTVALVLWVCRPPHEPGLELPLSRAPAALSRHRATAPATE
eukprot:g28425.t1